MYKIKELEIYEIIRIIMRFKVSKINQNTSEGNAFLMLIDIFL